MLLTWVLWFLALIWTNHIRPLGWLTLHKEWNKVGLIIYWHSCSEMSEHLWSWWILSSLWLLTQFQERICVLMETGLERKPWKNLDGLTNGFWHCRFGTRMPAFNASLIRTHPGTCMLSLYLCSWVLEPNFDGWWWRRTWRRKIAEERTSRNILCVGPQLMVHLIKPWDSRNSRKFLEFFFQEIQRFPVL